MTLDQDYQSEAIRELQGIVSPETGLQAQQDVSGYQQEKERRK